MSPLRLCKEGESSDLKSEIATWKMQVSQMIEINMLEAKFIESSGEGVAEHNVDLASSTAPGKR